MTGSLLPGLNMKAVDIKAALQKQYCQPEWAIFFEVSDGTGAASRRRADAIAMNMWPSRGLELRAFEIKVSRSDLASELKDPAKAEAVAQYCNTFYLAIPKGLAEGLVLPPTWGIIEVLPSGQSRISRQAEYNKTPIPPTVQFMASLIRAASKDQEKVIKAVVDGEVAKARESERQRVERMVQSELAARRSKADTLSELLVKIEAVTGKSATTLMHDPDFLPAVALVAKLGANSQWEGLGRIQKDLLMVNSMTAAMLEQIGEHIEQRQMEIQE